MKLNHFLSRVKHDRVHQAIQAAEKGTSARIVVYISHRRTVDPLKAAHAAFQKINLETASEKTGLLLFIAPKTRNFAVLGGTALHEKLGQPWLERLAQSLSDHFRREDFTHGLVSALEEAGRDLKTHFPATPSHANGGVDTVEN